MQRIVLQPHGYSRWPIHPGTSLTCRKDGITTDSFEEQGEQEQPALKERIAIFS